MLQTINLILHERLEEACTHVITINIRILKLNFMIVNQTIVVFTISSINCTEAECNLGTLVFL